MAWAACLWESMLQPPRVGWTLLACQNGASPDCIIVVVVVVVVGCWLLGSVVRFFSHVFLIFIFVIDFISSFSSFSSFFLLFFIFLLFSFLFLFFSRFARNQIFFGLNCFKISCNISFKEFFFEPSRKVPLWALFSFFSRVYSFTKKSFFSQCFPFFSFFSRRKFLLFSFLVFLSKMFYCWH